MLDYTICAKASQYAFLKSKQIFTFLLWSKSLHGLENVMNLVVQGCKNVIFVLR